MSSDIPTVVMLLAEARAAHEATGATLSKLEGLLAAEAKKAARKALKKEKAEKAAAEGSEAPEPLKPRGAWQAWLHGDPTPADGGAAVLPAKERYASEYAAYERTLPHKRGAAFNFASLATEACEGDPIAVPKPKQGEEGHEDESDEDYAERLEAWREQVHPLLVAAADAKGSPVSTHWTVNSASEYAEHEARYAALAEARSASGASSSKSKRVKLTEEEKLARREARKAETKAKNKAKADALKAEKEAEKAAKAKAKPAAKPPAVVKNAAIPAPKPATKPVAAAKPVAGAKVSAASLMAAADSDSDSSDSEEEAAPAPKAAAKAKAAPAPAPASASKPKAKAKAPPKAAPPPVEEDVGLTLVEVKGHGSVLKTEDNYLFASTAEAGEPGAYIGLLKADGSVDTKAENPFKHAE